MKKLPLNLHYLKYFCDSVKSGSISRAAKLNHVSQSAASQGIAKLEAELATQLISHQPNRFRVTAEGKKLFESAQAIFQAVRRTEDEISGFKEATLTFACTHSFALTYLPKYLKLAKEMLPHIQLNLRFGHYHTIKEMIKKGIVDFAFLIDNDNLTPFDCYPIFKGEYALFAAKEVKNLEKLSFLLDNDERMETNMLKKSYMAKYKRELPVFMEVASWAVISRLVEEGVGIGLAPDYICQGRSSMKKVLPELKLARYTLFAVFEKNNQPSSYAQAFLKMLK